MTQEELNLQFQRDVARLTKDLKALADVYYRTHSIDKDVFANPVFFNNNVFFKKTVLVATYDTTITLDVSKSLIQKTTTVNATGNATINASAGGMPGQELKILIVNDGTSGKTITFGTHFKSSGTLTGTASKSALISFISDGVNWYEQFRTLAIV